MAFHWIGQSSDGETVVLKRLKPELFEFPAYSTPEWMSANADLIRSGAVLDVETSGLSAEDSKIIEIGIRLFRFHRLTGEVLALGEAYSEFQDPGHALDPEITSLTGITDEMVRGRSIDWARVNALLESVHIVIAHNASFDRPFVDRLSRASAGKVWGCSLKQINWNAKGYTSSKLDVLSIYHGFFTSAHRALQDAEALLHLLGMKDQGQKTPYLLELLENARKTTVQVYAIGAPFETKDLLKSRSYRWDSRNRYWWKEVDQRDLEAETQWLEEFVYFGAFRGKTLEIPPSGHFKEKATDS